MVEVQNCIDSTSRRSKVVLKAMQQLLEVVSQSPQQFRIASMCLQVGAEIGALLRDSEAFKLLIEMHATDCDNRIVATKVGAFTIPLQMALSAFDLPQSKASEPESSSAHQDGAAE